MALNRDDALNNLNTRNLCVFLAQTALFCRENIQNKHDDNQEKVRVGYKMGTFKHFLPIDFGFLNLWWQCFLIRDHNQKETPFPCQETTCNHCTIKSCINQEYFKPDEEKGCRFFRHEKGCACATFECGNILLPISVFSCKSDFNMTENVHDTEMFIAHPPFAM